MTAVKTQTVYDSLRDSLEETLNDGPLIAMHYILYSALTCGDEKLKTIAKEYAGKWKNRLSEPEIIKEVAVSGDERLSACLIALFNHLSTELHLI